MLPRLPLLALLWFPAMLALYRPPRRLDGRLLLPAVVANVVGLTRQRKYKTARNREIRTARSAVADVEAGLEGRFNSHIAFGDDR